MPQAPVAPGLNSAGGWASPPAPTLQAGWRAPQGLPDHGGPEPRRAAHSSPPPPPQLGRLLSAHSTLRRHNDPWGWTGKLFVSGLVAVVMMGILVAVNFHHGGRFSPDYWVFAVIGAMVGGAAFGGI